MKGESISYEPFQIVGRSADLDVPTQIGIGQKETLKRTGCYLNTARKFYYAPNNTIMKQRMEKWTSDRYGTTFKLFKGMAIGLL